MKTLVLPLLLLFTTCTSLSAQDTLPRFTVRNVGNNRVIISWINKFQGIKQLSIQRSFDSLKNYRTILTVPDPTTPQNGFVDTKAPNDHMFYRLYILLENGVFLFSDVKKPVVDTLGSINTPPTVTPVENNVNKGKITGYVPSVYVYTHKDGYVRINLPRDPEKKYAIKFFEENASLLFELKDIKERTFKIDKTNFYHAGWFWFELYEDGNLVERHKFYLE